MFMMMVMASMLLMIVGLAVYDGAHDYDDETAHHCHAHDAHDDSADREDFNDDDDDDDVNDNDDADFAIVLMTIERFEVARSAAE